VIYRRVWCQCQGKIFPHVTRDGMRAHARLGNLVPSRRDLTPPNASWAPLNPVKLQLRELDKTAPSTLHTESAPFRHSLVTGYLGAKILSILTDRAVLGPPQPSLRLLGYCNQVTSETSTPNMIRSNSESTAITVLQCYFDAYNSIFSQPTGDTYRAAPDQYRFWKLHAPSFIRRNRLKSY
jgi:hypothetical protein